MSEWRGFLPESKSFMSYETRGFWQRVWFWLNVPAAFIRFKRAEWRGF